MRLAVSSRELAFVKDVGFLTRRHGAHGEGYVESGWDLRTTESGLTLSPTGETLVIGGTDTVFISFAEVRRIRIKRDRVSGFQLLTVSYLKGGHHWWNRRGIGQVVLRDFQFSQVADALNDLAALKGKLNL